MQEKRVFTFRKGQSGGKKDMKSLVRMDRWLGCDDEVHVSRNE